MDLLNRMMSYDKAKCTNQENCNCEECIPSNEETIKNQALKEYPSLSDEEIEQIINERYFYKDEKTKEFIRDALRVHGDRYDYSESIYSKCTDKVKIICREECHPSFKQDKYHHIRRKQGCPACNGTLLNAEIFIYQACQIKTNYLDYDYTRISYIKNDIPVSIFCKKCNLYFDQEPRIHLRGVGCPNCRENKSMNTERFVYEAKQIGTNSIDYNYNNSIYVDKDTKIEIYCNRCKKPFTQRYDAHLQGQGCPNCLSKRTLNSRIENFLQESKKLFNDLYDYRYIKEDYIDNDTVVRIICNSCGKTFKIRPRLHISGCGCTYCNMSKGEVKIMIYLENNDIKFERQFKFNDCKYKHHLLFDFYIPIYNLCIEFDGEQHFRKTKWGKNITNEEAEKQLKLNKIRDSIKTKYCKNNNINLLRIKYDENIEEKLNEYFSKYLTIFDL